MSSEPSSTVVVLDPLGFTLPYDRAFCSALAHSGVGVVLVGRRTGAEEAWNDRSFTYRNLGFVSPARPTRVHEFSWRLGSFIGHVRYVAGWVRLLVLLLVRRPDVLHAQWFPIPRIDEPFARLARRIVPVVVTAHDVVPYISDFDARTLKSWWRLLALADHVFVHTRSGLNEITRMGVASARATRIAHGSLAFAEPAPSHVPDAPPHPGRVHFLQFGFIKPYKGADTFVRAIGAMPRAVRERCRFVIAGKPATDLGPLYALIREVGVENDVTVRAHFHDNAEAAAVTGAADVFVFPYRSVQASGVLSLAIDLERPVVASAIGGFCEVIEDGTHGFLVPPDDPAALAVALTRLAEDGALRCEMARKVGELRRRSEGWESTVETVRDVYARVLRV